MKLVEIQEIDKIYYNQFVAAQPSGSFLQSSEWGEWQEKLGRKIFRYWILGNSNEKIGSVQFIKMSLPFGKYYLYAPYGPLLRQGFEGQAADIVSAFKQKFSEAVFIRIESKNNFQSSALQKSSNIQPGKTLLIDLNKSEDELLKEMHSKTRYNIKVAQKHGVEIKDEFAISIGHGLFFDEAIKLIAKTAKRQKFTTFPVSYYKNMADSFALKKGGDVHLHIYKAIFQNQLLATAFMVDFYGRAGSRSAGGTRTFLFGGSSEFHKNVMAPYLMHWRAMQDAKAAGMKCYDFWGIETSSGETPGFVRFKLGFGGQEQQYSGAWDLVINQLHYKAYRALRKINKIKNLIFK